MNNRKNTSEKYPSAAKRFAIGAATVLTAGALVGVGAQGAFAASPDGGASGSASATATASPHGSSASGTAGLSLKGLQHDVAGAFSGRIDGAKAQAFAKKIVANTALFSLLPANLQSDLTTLKDASVSDRAADAKKLVSTALGGGYGSTIQSLAKQVGEDHGKSLKSIAREVLGGLKSGDGIGAEGAAIATTVTGDAELRASLPTALQDDLAQLANAPAGERTADVQKVATTALSGGYGDSVQKIAEQIQTDLVSAR